MSVVDTHPLLMESSAAIDPLLRRFREIRARSEEICAPLAIEDYVVQPVAEVSPPKWHLGHVTWFFETFVLQRYQPDYRLYREDWPWLFNSYYKTVSRHWLQGKRGALSRPTVAEVLAWRRHVDECMTRLLPRAATDPDLCFLIEAGLHHEQQHQELLLMDIKYILGSNPLWPRYSDLPPPVTPHVPASWRRFAEGLYDCGAADGGGFHYDNEGPRHRVWLGEFAMATRLVSNGEYLEFIDDGGYLNPQYWLSKGWDWINAHAIQAPLYWFRDAGQWHEYTLHGTRPLAPDAPLCHVSYFEADAYARWKGARLPTEQEFECFLSEHPVNVDQMTAECHPGHTGDVTRQVWCWTQSHYSPYPGFRPFAAELGEYNGKFMCGQFVLRGGCIATPADHYRHTYRNFFEPHQRWMFSGIRLAEGA